MFDSEFLAMTTILAIISSFGAWAAYDTFRTKESWSAFALLSISSLIGGCCCVYSVIGWLGLLAETIGLLYFAIIILSILIVLAVVIVVVRLHKAGKLKFDSIKNNWRKYLRRAIILALVLSLAWGIDRFILSHEVEGLHTVCYVTDTGECYHSSGCSYLRSRNKTTVYRAKRRGYRDCSRCSIGKLDISTKHEPFWSLAISSSVIGIAVLIGKKEK